MRCASVLAFAALAASCGERQPDEVRVFAASSLTEVMQTIAADFEKETGVKVKLNLASSSTLAKQIVEGAPCDVFLSADEEWADFVEKAGLVEPGTRRDLLTNDLTVVFPPGDYGPSLKGMTIPDYDTDLEAHKRWLVRVHLTHASIRRIAMGDPGHVPAGRYSKEALEGFGLWKDVEGKVVACESVRAALALVERGEADAGIVYVTDASASTARRSATRAPYRFYDTVEYDSFDVGQTIHVPRRVIPNPANPIRYQAMQIGGSNESARRFNVFLNSLEAQKVYEAAGFGLARKVD